MKKNNPELNKEVYRIVNKINDKDSFEQIVSEVLTDSNFHPEAFKFATILDKSIKTKEDWYKSDRFNANEENTKIALKISQLSHWDANYFGPALEFALKMKGFHRIAEALEQALSTDATNDYPNAIDEITKRQSEYAQEIANRTGLRQGAVAEFIAKNGLNEKETLNLLQGLGMKKLEPRDFMTAVTGVPNNEYEIKIVAFAKSNEAFKTPEPTTKPTPKAISKGNLSSFARYISKRNIKSLVAEIDGKEYTFSNSDIVDGVYVLKDNIKESKPSKKTPKVTRTQFEEEEFEFGNGGGVSSNTFYVKNNFGHWSVIDSRNNKMVVGYSQKEDANITANGLNNIDNSNELEETISQLQTQKGYAHFLNKYAQGGEVGNNLQVELGAYKGDGSNAIAIKFQRISIKNIDEAINLVRRFINENDLGMGEFVGAQIYDNNKAIAYISYNLRVWKGKIGNMNSEPYKYAQGGGVKTDKYGFHLEPQFKVGDEITMHGFPGKITGVHKGMYGRYSYDVSFIDSKGFNRASNFVDNKANEIKVRRSKMAKGGGVDSHKKVQEIDYYSSDWQNKTTEEKRAIEKKMLDEAGIGVNDIVFEEKNGKKYFGKVFEVKRESDWPSTYYVNLMRNTEGSPSNSQAKISGFSLYKKYHGFNVPGKKPFTYDNKLMLSDLPKKITIDFLIDHPIIVNSANKSAFKSRNEGQPDLIIEAIQNCIYFNTFDNNFYKNYKYDEQNNFAKQYVDLYYQKIYNPMIKDIDEAIEKYFDVTINEYKGNTKKNEIVLTYKDKTKPEKFNIEWFKNANYIPYDLRKTFLEYHGVKNFKIEKSDSNQMAKGGGVDKNIQVKTTNQIIANDIMKYADLQNVKATQTKSGRNYIINLSSELEMRESMTGELKKVLYPNKTNNTLGWKHKK